ncbi:AAA family ATPase [Actinomadura fulvescens]|uniref:CobQ/CobB/MinD/ParA nucleotide binding domain-containing protein n=1 Tax=Actinomadura fulvescens TaxID=46160 RepID=A0ABN3Q162_9ACTN
MIIAVAGTVGGIGRTTTALGLATAATAAGADVVVVDGDPQHDGDAAARGITALAQMLGHQPPLRVLSLTADETIRWAAGQGSATQVSTLDLPGFNQQSVLAVAHAVVVPVPEGDMRTIGSLLPLRFRMVTAESGAPVFVLVHSVQDVSGGPDDTWRVALSGLGVQPLDSRLPYSTRIAQAARSPWSSDWTALAEEYAPVWAELRSRLGLADAPAAVGP